MATVLEKITILENRLEEDPDAKKYARDEDGKYAELDAIRKELCSDLYRKVDNGEIFAVDDDVLFRQIRVCMTFDRANASLRMKLAFKDPNCPAGFVWITKDDLEKLEVKGVPVQYTDPITGTVAKQMHSINKRYALCAKDSSFEGGVAPDRIKELVANMSRPMAPAWMCGSADFGIETFD